MQREQIDNLIVQLIVIKEFSKDIHYTCHGEAFYAKHLLVDKFDWDEHIDLLKECCLLGNDERPKTSKEYLELAIVDIETPQEHNDKQNFEILNKLVYDGLALIENMPKMYKGDENVIGGIAQDLQQYKGLINLQVE